MVVDYNSEIESLALNEDKIVTLILLTLSSHYNILIYLTGYL